MVRTRSDRVPARVSAGKGASKSGKTTTSTPVKVAIGSKAKGYSGGNRAHPRETPDWQKPITRFLNQSSNEDVSEPGPSTSRTQGKRAMQNDSDTE